MTLDFYLYPIYQHESSERAKSLGIVLRESAHYIDIVFGSKIVRISKRHSIYLSDIVNNFSYYFDAVWPLKIDMGEEFDLVDYSLPKFHRVKGFNLFPIFFPSFAEPIVTTQQYLDFSGLEGCDVAIDLGAYSGLSSILMKERVGDHGIVLAVDADPKNIDCMAHNFSMYTKITGSKIEQFESAVWNHSKGIVFSSEGNMGSSAIEIVGNGRGDNIIAPSITLSQLMDKFSLSKVDFIKCDIEGAEAVIFEDNKFFATHRPKIIIEPHHVNGILTTDKFKSDLQVYGYSFREVTDVGMGGDLIECVPSD
jgi:FkbM family methyltransferase